MVHIISTGGSQVAQLPPDFGWRSISLWVWWTGQSCNLRRICRRFSSVTVWLLACSHTFLQEWHWHFWCSWQNTYLWSETSKSTAQTDLLDVMATIQAMVKMNVSIYTDGSHYTEKKSEIFQWDTVAGSEIQAGSKRVLYYWARRSILNQIHCWA